MRDLVKRLKRVISYLYNELCELGEAAAWAIRR